MTTRSLEPRTQRPQEVEGLVDFLASVASGRLAIYMSAPITTGRRFSEWHATPTVRALTADDPSYRGQHFEMVIAPNRASAQTVAAKLRRESKGVVIDPTSVPDFAGWSQDDYRWLWALVIERYAKLVVFLDGWEYSSGCAYEFLTACRRSIPMATELGRPLTPADGLRLIAMAAEDSARHNFDVSFLRWVLQEAAVSAIGNQSRSAR